MNQIIDRIAWLQNVYGHNMMIVIAVGILLLTIAIAYLAGGLNGAVIVSKFILHDDVRNHGSGNAGLTNFYRVFGGPLTLLVILTDVLKAVISILIGMGLVGYYLGQGDAYMIVLGKCLAGTVCILGHMFPCTFHFRGGKGIMSGGIFAIMLDWRIAVIVWGLFVISVLLTRWVSLGSCLAGIAFPISTCIVYRDVFCTALTFICGFLIVWKHAGNIRRIFQGTESKFSFHHKKEAEQ